MRVTNYIALAAVLAVGLLGCDDIDFQEGTSLPQTPVLQDTAARSRVSLEGLESLYELRWAGGVPVEFDRRIIDAQFDYTALGPLDSTVDVTRWTVSTTTNRVRLTAEADNFEVIVPIRIDRGFGTRICRVRIAADQMEATVPIRTRGASDPDATAPESLTAMGPPAVTYTNRRVELIGSCPPLESSQTLDAELDANLLAYVDDATTELAIRMSEITPSAELGLLDNDVELDHLTAFENRRGSLSIFSVPTDGSSGLSDSGYTLDLDMAADSSRAGCAPPEQFELPAAVPAAPVPLSTMQAANAEVALALSTRTLSALAKNGVRAGFACTGLEDGPFSEASAGAVSTDNLALERVGLGDLDVGSFAVPVISPVTIPTVSNEPSTGVVELSWTDLGIDIYAEVRGVPVRILQLNATFDFTLQPSQSRGTTLSLQIGSIEVSSARVRSQWSGDTEIDDPEQWGQRLILLLFENRLQLPLPVEPGAPLELMSTQVRTNDLLLLLRINTRL